MTPQDVAVQIATKTLNMFRTLKVPILGVIENMSYVRCGTCGNEIALFGRGGARLASQDLGVPFLGAIPLEPEISSGGDRGEPLLTTHPESASASVFRDIASGLVRELGLEARTT
jgi:ATP-binding protein involved in chromosome partitioning